MGRGCGNDCRNQFKKIILWNFLTLPYPSSGKSTENLEVVSKNYFHTELF